MPASGELAAGLAGDIMTSMYYGARLLGRRAKVKLTWSSTYTWVVDGAVLVNEGKSVFELVRFTVTYGCNRVSLQNIVARNLNPPLNPIVEPAWTVAMLVSPGVFCMSSS